MQRVQGRPPTEAVADGWVVAAQCLLHHIATHIRLSS